MQKQEIKKKKERPLKRPACRPGDGWAAQSGNHLTAPFLVRFHAVGAVCLIQNWTRLGCKAPRESLKTKEKKKSYLCKINYLKKVQCKVEQQNQVSCLKIKILWHTCEITPQVTSQSVLFVIAYMLELLVLRCLSLMYNL